MTHSSSEDDTDYDLTIQRESLNSRGSPISRNQRDSQINQSPSALERLLLKKQQHELQMKSKLIQSNFISHLADIGFVAENQIEKIKVIIDGVQERSQMHQVNMKDSQILSVSFKEYLFSLDDFWISKLCSAFVEKWIQNQTHTEQQRGTTGLSQRSFTSRERSEDGQASIITNKNQQSVQQSIKSQSFKSSIAVTTSSHIDQITSRLQSPTISQLQKMRRQNEEMIENIGSKLQRSQNGKDRTQIHNQQMLISQLEKKSQKEREGSRSARYQSPTYSSQNDDNSRPISSRQRSPPDPKIFERLYEESKIKKQFKEQVEEIKILNELKECTFQPIISSTQQYNAQQTLPGIVQEQSQAKAQIVYNDNISNISAIDYASSSGVPPSRDEFFNNLAKSGVKTMRVQGLEKIKEQQELSKCTFQPKVLSKSISRQAQKEEEEEQDSQLNVPVWERLHNEHQDVLELKKLKELQKEQFDLKECTFVPQINNQKKQFNAYGSIEEDPQTEVPPDPYTRLYQQHNEYQNIKRQREIESKQREIEQCTFSPQRITQAKDQKYNALNQRSTDRFEKLYKDGSLKQQERNFDQSKQLEQESQTLKSSRSHHKNEVSNTQRPKSIKVSRDHLENQDQGKFYEGNSQSQHKLSQMIQDLTNHPQTTKNKVISIQNDFMQRNQQFIEKKNLKMQQMQQQQKTQEAQIKPTHRKNRISTMHSPTAGNKISTLIKPENQKSYQLKNYSTLASSQAAKSMQKSHQNLHSNEQQTTDKSINLTLPLSQHGQSYQDIQIHSNFQHDSQSIQNEIQKLEERKKALEKLNRNIQVYNSTNNPNNHKNSTAQSNNYNDQIQQLLQNYEQNMIVPQSNINEENSVISYLQKEVSRMSTSSKKDANIQL